MGEKNWMKKVVHFTDIQKLGSALENFNINSFRGKEVPVKLHMGEIKNKYYPKSEFVKKVIATIKKYDINPFLFDTTVSYPGLRSSKLGYHKLAKIHGFSKKKVGCEVKIDDSGKEIMIEERNYEVANIIIQSTHIFALSHVKGHVATGMGGAIKNFGMGGVTKKSKREMHNGSKPIYQKDKCTFCGICAEVCPFNAIKTKEDSWNLNSRKCFGCGVCVENCKAGGVTYKDADFQFVLTCAAKACVQDKNVLYLNDVNRISSSCDCDPFAGPPICPDIGFLVSDDIVAVDKASLDLIHGIKPKIFEKVNHVNPNKQIKYGEEIGLGSSSYELIKI